MRDPYYGASELGTVGARNGKTVRAQRPVEVEYPSPENDPPWRKREYPTHGRRDMSGQGSHQGSEQEALGGEWWDAALWRSRPMNEYQALMETAPGGEPEVHAEQLLAIREAIADALDSLPEREREAFDGVFVRQDSLRDIGLRLGYSKMHVSRIRDRAVQMLREQLADHPAVVAYFTERGSDDE